MDMPVTFIQRSNYINAIIETPKGSGVKYNFDEETGSFKLKKILPDGLVFPFHFGFIPGTLAEDHDPLDVLVFMDEASWPGCIIECKVVGVIKAEQKIENNTQRNDRIIVVPLVSKKYKTINSIFDFDKPVINETENFLESYTQQDKKQFQVIGKEGPEFAIKLIKKAGIK